ncbi:DEAD/DEAH box helicase [Georgenia muralis]|uniref:Helicase-like protein n=1 Tax=Georgenia muralis TaxID=154117 RepID=A0A3N4YWU7_9MICO|nr:DEAD/DEAH box helicase [Georgenia muralis]RPF25679.1 helicase-like protein [Georgenia muralis]
MSTTTGAALNVLLDDLEDAAGTTPDAIYEAFTSWAAASGLPPYPHQEEALMSLVAGDHVILATPTGSGKSLVAMGALFTALATGRTGYYTAPLKALVSEKFFDLVDLFGSANVGMVTGDSAINPGAPIICCTAEILANQALRDGGAGADGDALVCMDEFHFYADPQRGWAWQVPLLELTGAQFLLMSATLGDVSFFATDLRRRTGTDVVVVADAERPVPLTYAYSVEPIQDLLLELVQTHRSPVYVVHFAQKDAVERAQSLTSVQVATREQRDRVADALGDFRFGPGFGVILSRLLRHGVGVHHAGMLPRYRRLVERLTQQGLLGVVCGTDTLGVGINVPIRTVVVTSLTKYDGERSRHLTAREFHQIAGRAGRAGFDTTGEVIVQAPDHVIENAKALAKAGDDERKRRKIVRKKAPAGAVNWTDKTFERLRDADPEPLTSQFHVTHTMVLSVLARPGDPVAAMYRLLTDNHEPERERNPHLRRAVEIYRSLRTAGVVEHAPASWRREHPGEPYVRLTVDLPRDFALNAPLSPFALAALDLLDPDHPDFALDVVSVIEATLEDPRPLLYAQQRAAKGEAVGAMKAEGLEYDERMALLEDVTWPQPLAELLGAALVTYRRTNPWVSDYELHPKSVVREMVEQAMTFSELVSRYQLARSEGVVLRYLTDAYRALRQVVPDAARTEEVAAIIDWLGELVRSVDSSLLDEWEALAAGAAAAAGAVAVFDDTPTAVERRFGAAADGVVAFTRNRHAFRVAVRNALFRRVELAAREAYEVLGRLDGDAGWDAERWSGTLDGYWREYDWLGTGPEARSATLVDIDEHPTDADVPDGAPRPGVRTWLARQTFDDPAGDHDWGVTALVDLDASDAAGTAVVRVVAVGPR